MGAGHDGAWLRPRATAVPQASGRPDRQTEFALVGRRWTLLPGVFAPTYTPVTELFTAWIPYPVGGTLLEMGSGTGVTAVSAALAGCRRVTALDISAAAVENTRRNVERHGVADRVDVRQSDLFDALSAGRAVRRHLLELQLRRGAARLRQRQRPAPRVLRSRLRHAPPLPPAGAATT